MENLDDIIQFVENEGQDLYALKVIDGPFKDVIYTYGKVSIHEDEANDQLNIKFDFVLNDVPKNLDKAELEKSEEFKNFMGDILSELLEEKLLNDESTNTNTKNTN